MDREAVSSETIVAIATPPGRGGISVIRASGSLVPVIAKGVLGNLPRERYAEYGAFRNGNGEVIDRGIALYFVAPHSYTGEYVLELHSHGSPVVADALIRRFLELGARQAHPGEFSERAFLNNKQDLTQAEAIADLIASNSEQAARAAQRSLQGDFSARINDLVEQLTQLRIYVESAIDFAEEDIDFLSEANVVVRLNELLSKLDELKESAYQGSLLREGASVVIAGRPNVGKSSLMNRLSGYDSAIVTEIPGTTRDVLREQITLKGVPLQLIDTAGFHESQDFVEQEGIRRARAEVERADWVLLMTDDRVDVGPEEQSILGQLPTGVGVSIVSNKCDLSGNLPVLRSSSSTPMVRLSVKSGAGVDLLVQHLLNAIGYRGSQEGCFSARRRHIEALTRARDCLESARERSRVELAGEILAEDLKQAQSALSEITGAFTTEDLLGKIFSSFCIGK